MECFVGICSKTIPNSTIYCHEYVYDDGIDNCDKVLYIYNSVQSHLPHVYLLYVYYLCSICAEDILIYNYLIFIDVVINNSEYAHFHLPNNVVYLIFNANITNRTLNSLQYYLDYTPRNIRSKLKNYNQYSIIYMAPNTPRNYFMVKYLNI